ncbi:hypothetical protein [Candidatus Amarolinea dominans]|uniref:hypothetical protein n=1 Tax=Candidatus Amarolinea dominans TaxID=3140696 RepID=UPI0031CCBC9F
MRNLDTLAAQTAQKIYPRTLQSFKKTAEVENLATKALGVCRRMASMPAPSTSTPQAQTPNCEHERSPALDGIGQRSAWGRSKTAPSDRCQDVAALRHRSVCSDLDTLLLVKQLWEQTLIYVRYGAKARGCEP